MLQSADARYMFSKTGCLKSAVTVLQSWTLLGLLYFYIRLQQIKLEPKHDIAAKLT